MSDKVESDWCDALNREDGARLYRLLISNPRLVSLDYFGCTALHLAMRKSWYGLVNEILRKFDHLHASPRAGAFAPPSDENQFFDIDIFRYLLTAKEGAKEGETDERSPTPQIWRSWKSDHLRGTGSYASGFDVFAMAVIQGNMAINAILAEAVCAVDELFNDGHPYKNVIKAIPTSEAVLRFSVDDNSERGTYTESLTKIMMLCFRTDVQTTSFDDEEVSLADRVRVDFVETQDVEGDTERASEASIVAPSLSRVVDSLAGRTLSTFPKKLDARWLDEWLTTSPFLPLEEFLLLICCRQKITNFLELVRISNNLVFLKRVRRYNDSDFLELVRRCTTDSNFLELVRRCTTDSNFLELVRRCTIDSDFFNFFKELVRSPRDFFKFVRKCTNSDFLELERRCIDSDFLELVRRCTIDSDFLELVRRCTTNSDFESIQRCTIDPNFLELVRRCTIDSDFLKLVRKCTTNSDFFEFVQRCNNSKFLELVRECNDLKFLEFVRKCNNSNFLELVRNWNHWNHPSFLESVWENNNYLNFLEFVMKTNNYPNFLEFVKGVNDTQATAMHYAMRCFNTSCVEYFSGNKQDTGINNSWRDSLGRTPYHTFVALGKSAHLGGFGDSKFSREIKSHLLAATWDPSQCQFWEHPRHNLGVLGASRWYVDVNTVSKVNGYGPTEMIDALILPCHLMCSPYNAEINFSHCVKSIPKWLDFDRSGVVFNVLNQYLRAVDMERKIRGILQLAAFIGATEAVQLLANDDYIYDIARLYNKSEGNGHNYSALHVAAIAGHPQIIRIILATGKFDPGFKDYEGNTALHLATHVEIVKLPNTLTDFVEIPKTRMGVSYKYKDDLTPKERKEMAGIGESKRQGCINLLLQEGIDIWETNDEKQIADPGPEASPEYSTWWFEKLTKETQEIKTRLNAAANAISVTAALVATASYVGPLQPPLGYAQPESRMDGMQVEILSVRIFIVCNTLAFYLALGSIMLSLTPSLPMPQESTLKELKLTRRSVTLALALLIISIMGILSAFASASIAVISNEGSWNHGGVTVSTLAVGGMICLVVLILCFLRLVRLICYKNKHVRVLYGRCVHI